MTFTAEMHKTVILVDPLGNEARVQMRYNSLFVAKFWLVSQQTEEKPFAIYDKLTRTWHGGIQWKAKDA